jgi:hypothetical protein
MRTDWRMFPSASVRTNGSGVIRTVPDADATSILPARPWSVSRHRSSSKAWRRRIGRLGVPLTLLLDDTGGDQRLCCGGRAALSNCVPTGHPPIRAMPQR